MNMCCRYCGASMDNVAISHEMDESMAELARFMCNVCGWEWEDVSLHPDNWFVTRNMDELFFNMGGIA